MKIRLYLTVIIFFTVHSLMHSNTHEPEFRELLELSSAIPISPADFESGSYRITQPGYYYLTDNITFNPIPAAEASRTDKPDIGWFAALSIECDNVVLDLNTKTLQVAQEFVDNQFFKVFSLIELNNSPFPHFVFGFKGETELKNAKNVVIKNGTLGRSSHHGIHGNSNVSITLEDLTVRDWEVAGIALNGLKNGVIKNIIISGIEHPVPFTGLRAVTQMAVMQLDKLKAAGDPNVQPFIDALAVIANDPQQNGSNHNSQTHDGNCYGLFLNRTVDVGPLPTHCDDQTTNCISIENVTVCNMKTKIIETVGIADLEGNRLKGETFGVMRWDDAYPQGTFAPNARLKAQAYAVNKNNPSKLPSGFANNILAANPTESVFLSHVQPIFNGDFAGHTNKGAFGIRIDCGHGVRIKNCHVYGINNIGQLGATLANLPGGSAYNFTQERYTGNEVFGISLVGCHNCQLIDSSAFECTSISGFVHGINIMNESKGNILVNCVSSDHATEQDDINSVVNPSSKTYGFFVTNNSNGNELHHCTSKLLSSPRYSYGFLVHNVETTLLKKCNSWQHTAFASSNFSSAKYALGFASQGSSNTTFKKCQATDMRCTNEENETNQTASLAAGFMLNNDENMNGDNYSVINNCKSFAHNGGAGQAIGIFMENTQYATIKNNVLRHNYTANCVGSGIGLKVVTADTTLITKNIVHGDTAFNFDVTYQDSFKSLPVIYSTHYHFVNNDKFNHGYNLSIGA